MRPPLLSLLLAATLIGGGAPFACGEDAVPAATPAANAPAAGAPAPAAPAADAGAPAAAAPAAPAAAAADAPAAAPAAAPAPAAAADTPAKGKNKGDKLSIDQLPDLVKATFTKEAPEATTIVKMAGKNGSEDTYRARYTDKDGHKMMITVGADGALIDKGQAKGKNKGN